MSRTPALRLARLGAAAVSGLLLVLAFPPVGLWWCAPIAVAGLTLAVRGSRLLPAAGTGFVFGAVFFVGLMPWLRVVGPDAWVLLSLFSACYLAVLAAAVSLVQRLAAWPLWVACLWVLEELVRGRFPFGGFPWGRLAFSQSDSPLTALVSLGGTALLTFAVALAGTLLAWCAVRVRRTRRVDLRLVAAVAGCAVLVLVGLAVPLPSATATDHGRTVTAAVVQGNVPRTGLDAFDQRETVLRNHVQASAHLAADVAAGRTPQPDLVVWPENSSDIDPFYDPAAYQMISNAVDALGVPTLVGLVVAAPDPTKVENEGVVWSPGTGPGQTYVKRHPVPFGEYVPFRHLLSTFVSRFDRVPRDFQAGTKPGLLQVGPARLGDVICFEVAYDGVVRDVVRDGADVLAVQTNNATYGRTGQVEQQLAMSRLRAVEHGRAVLVAATSGISAIIAPDGSILAQAPEFTQDSLVERVPLRTALTWADRLTVWPEWLLAMLGLAAVVVAAGQAMGDRRRRRQLGASTTSTADEGEDAAAQETPAPAVAGAPAASLAGAANAPDDPHEPAPPPPGAHA